MALEAERQAYLERYAAAVDEEGRRLVVGNGHARAREITTAAGRLAVQAPRIDDRRDGERYISALLPPYMRRSPQVTELLPLLYLRGLSTGDFVPALSAFFGSEASLSASTVSRLSEAWQAEHERWRRRSLAAVDYVYLWADGLHFNVRLEEDRLCCLVLVGVRPDGRKELVAVQDGYREDTRSWLDLLRELRERGMRDPELVVGDGALGFWAALREVFPRTREQRCWVHKTQNVLAALPERVQREANRALHAVSGAPRRSLRRPPSASSSRSGRRRQRRSQTTSNGCWRSTTSPPSTTCTCARRTRSSPPSPRCGCASASRRARARGQRGWRWPTSLLDAAQQRWRRVNAPQLFAVVRAGGVFRRRGATRATG